MLKKKILKPTYKNPLIEKLKVKRSRCFANVRHRPLPQLVKSFK